MKPSLVSKKYKKQFLELEYLYAELDYYEEGLKEAQQEFQEAFYDYSETNNLEYKRPEEQKIDVSSRTDISFYVEGEEKNYYYSNSSNENEPSSVIEEPIDNVDEKDEDLIKLYKKIAAITHPDTIPKNEKEELRNKRIQQFIEAQAAHKDKNWFKLCQIAISLGLETPEPKKQHLKWMDEEAVRIRNRIEHIKTTYSWVWYNEEQESKKNNIMKSYFSAIAVKK